MLEEIPLHDGVGVYEDYRISARCGDAPVVAAGEAYVLLVPDQVHPGRNLRRLHTVVVDDEDLEVPVTRLLQGLDTTQRQRPGSVVDDNDGELHRDTALSRSRRAMLAVASSDDSLRSLRTSASESFFLFCISARFPSISGRWRHAPASPSRCARKEPVTAAVIRRPSCPAAKKGSMYGTAERGKFLTSKLKELRLPSLVAVGLRLPPVEALPCGRRRRRGRRSNGN